MYLWFKALHLIGMVTWFAGLFYMFRLFVYWVESQKKNEAAKVLSVMSHKLYYYITTPAMVFTLVMGLGLVTQVPAYLQSSWFQLKLLLLAILVSYHYLIGYTLKRFKKNDFFLSSKQCRFINEVPVFFLVSIVLLAVFKPWT